MQRSIMSLSPLQEIFVLLENEKKVPLYRLNRWGTKTRGVLGKLVNYSWAEKIIINNEVYYQITGKGEKQFDKYLKPLKKSGNWDGRWRLVIFDVPESKRNIRDKLRRYLMGLGLGILQASVWISPNDIKKDIDEIAQKLDLGSCLKYFEVSRNTNLDNTILEKSWNLPELEDKYKKFIFETKRILNVIQKDPNARFTSKKYILEYALILQKDPKLPLEFRHKDELDR